MLIIAVFFAILLIAGIIAAIGYLVISTKMEYDLFKHHDKKWKNVVELLPEGVRFESTTQGMTDILNTSSKYSKTMDCNTFNPMSVAKLEAGMATSTQQPPDNLTRVGPLPGGKKQNKNSKPIVPSEHTVTLDPPNLFLQSEMPNTTTTKMNTVLKASKMSSPSTANTTFLVSNTSQSSRANRSADKTSLDRQQQHGSKQQVRLPPLEVPKNIVRPPANLPSSKVPGFKPSLTVED